jgi:hypothetical protein
MEYVHISCFECRGKRYHLVCPLNVDVERSDGLWVCRNDWLNLWGTGELRADALRDLNRNFAHLWREYAEEDDAVLDDGARELKRRLLDLCKSDASAPSELSR